MHFLGISCPITIAYFCDVCFKNKCILKDSMDNEFERLMIHQLQFNFRCDLNRKELIMNPTQEQNLNFRTDLRTSKKRFERCHLHRDATGTTTFFFSNYPTRVRTYIWRDNYLGCTFVLSANFSLATVDTC